MKHITVITSIFLMASIAIISCKRGVTSGYSKTKDGLYYKIIKSTGGTKAKIGEVVAMHIQTMTVKDSVIFSTYKSGKPYEMKLAIPQFKGDMLAGIPMMAPGDSALFLVNVDSLYKSVTKNQRPPMFKEGYMKFTVKLLSSEEETNYRNRKDAEAKAYADKENKLLEDILKTYPAVQTTPSGLKYVITKQGNGKQAVNGKKATLHYTGKLLNGTKFDSSLDRNQPFSFVVGEKQVIPGWDEGISLLKEGSKATFFIPANIGYGNQQAGPIPPGSTLHFDVELLKVEDAPKADDKSMFP